MQAYKQQLVMSFILRMISKGSTYVLLLILGNLYTKNAFGTAQISFSLFNILLMGAIMGLPLVFVPWLIRGKDAKSAIIILFMISISLLILGMIFGDESFRIISLAFPFALAMQLSSAFLERDKRYGTSQMILLVSAIMVPILAYLLYPMEQEGILLAYAISYMISGLLGTIIVFPNLKAVMKKGRYSWNNAWSYLRSSLYVMVLSVSFTILFLSDTALLGLFKAYEDAARYNIAGPISLLLTMVPATLGGFVLVRSSETKGRKYLGKTLRISLALTIVLGISLSSLIRQVMKLFFPAYPGLETSIIILSLGMVFFSVYSLIHTFFVTKMKISIVFWPVAAAAVLNVILDLLLFPGYGILGIAVATSISHLFAYLILLKRVGMFWQFLPMIFLLPSFPAAYYLGIWGLLLIIPAVILLYLARLIRNDDIRAVLS